MKKNFYNTSIIIVLLLSITEYSCKKQTEQHIIVKEKLTLAEVEALYYKIKPLQDSIEYISNCWKNRGEEALYGISFNEDSLNYSFTLGLKDQYIVGVEYKLLKKDNIYVLLGGEKRLEDTLTKDTLIQYFQREGKISFDMKPKYDHFPYIDFIINKNNLDSVRVYSGY